MAAPRTLRDESFDRFVPPFARIYVVSVFVIAALALCVWLVKDASVALGATIAVLVVTCPCAIGLATPLAYEIVVSRLRRAGVYLHSGGALDRLAEVQTVAFDKTGTLTGDALVLTLPPSADVKVPLFVRFTSAAPRGELHVELSPAGSESVQLDARLLSADHRLDRAARRGK